MTTPGFSQIERANIAELDWALANMDPSGKGKKHQKPANELMEADAKIKEDVSRRRQFCSEHNSLDCLVSRRALPSRVSAPFFSMTVRLSLLLYSTN